VTSGASAPSPATVPAPSAPVTAWSMPHRLLRLVAGQALFAVSLALLVRSQAGATPWDVLHLGLHRQLGISVGTASFAVGVVLLLLWLPLRVRPGVGTLCNVVLVSVGVDAALAVLPPASSAAAATALVVSGIVLNAVATALYVGASLGPGPRDGLMTGLVARTGGSVRVVRITIEVLVVAAGWALGGTVGIATLAYALAIGPLVHVLMPRLAMPPAAS